MKYEKYQVEDFIKDEFFVAWVLATDDSAAQFWDKWLKANPEKRTAVAQAKEFVLSLHYKDQSSLSDSEYSLIFERILRDNEEQAPVRSRIDKKIIYGIAASVILLIAAFLSGITVDDSEKEVVINQLKVTTDFGQRRTIKLPDGTLVKLNAGSSIEYPEVFGNQHRSVKLRGEAYFDVVKKTNLPFIIESNDLTTEVLGTTFNIAAYPEDRAISVAVVSGKVRISNGDGALEVLDPAELGVFDKQDKSIKKGTYGPDLLAWYHGVLIFENESLPNVFTRLSKWYGVTFEFEDGLDLGGTYSGKYQNKSLKLVLEGISYTTKIKYSINQKRVSIMKE